MNDDVKGFMIVPVTVSGSGDMKKLSEITAIYPLPDSESLVPASVKHGDDEWILSIGIAKKV